MGWQEEFGEAAEFWVDPLAGDAVGVTWKQSEAKVRRDGVGVARMERWQEVTPSLVPVCSLEWAHC